MGASAGERKLASKNRVYYLANTPLRHRFRGPLRAKTQEMRVKAVSPMASHHVCRVEMSALERPAADGLAQLLMNAADALAAPLSSQLRSLAPLGLPVRSGRLALGRLRGALGSGGSREVEVAAGFGTATWLGPAGFRGPDLGRLVWTTIAALDSRARVVLDRRACAYLAVADASRFEVVPLMAPGGGLLLVPVEDFERRLNRIEP